MAERVTSVFGGHILTAARGSGKSDAQKIIKLQSMGGTGKTAVERALADDAEHQANLEKPACPNQRGS
jgi:hypothetical protein